MRRVKGDRFTAFQVGLIALVVLVVATFLAVSKDIPFTRPFELNAAFQNAPPIQRGQAVRIADVIAEANRRLAERSRHVA